MLLIVREACARCCKQIDIKDEIRGCFVCLLLFLFSVSYACLKFYWLIKIMTRWHLGKKITKKNPVKCRLNTKLTIVQVIKTPVYFTTSFAAYQPVINIIWKFQLDWWKMKNPGFALGRYWGGLPILLTLYSIKLKKQREKTNLLIAKITQACFLDTKCCYIHSSSHCLRWKINRKYNFFNNRLMKRFQRYMLR